MISVIFSPPEGRLRRASPLLRRTLRLGKSAGERFSIRHKPPSGTTPLVTSEPKPERVPEISLVFLSTLFTGLNIYPKIAKFGGAGALVPITGFANSVAAPAIEFQKEGQVFGIGCKIFTICGPVVLYGIFTSWVLGLVYWLSTVMI